MNQRHHVEANPRIRSLVDLVKLDAGDMRAMTAPVDTRFRSFMSQQFATEGASGGERWAELSSPYRKWKRRHYPGRKILSRGGRLRKSLAGKGAEHVAYGYTQPSATIIVGSAVEYGIHHAPRRRLAPATRPDPDDIRAGPPAPRGGGSLPRRDPIQMTSEQGHQLKAIVSEYLIRVKLARVLRVLERGAGELSARLRGLK